MDHMLFALGIVADRLGWSVIAVRRPKGTCRDLAIKQPLVASKLKAGVWLRVPMYSSIVDFLAKDSAVHSYSEKIAVEVGGCEGTIKTALEQLGVKYVVAEDFPKVDIHKMPYESKSFDFFVADQVFEHIERPWIAVQEIERVLRPRGLAIVSSVLLFSHHASPPWKPLSDFWRFTPDAYRILFRSFEVMEASGWGNAEVLRAAYQEADIEGHRLIREEDVLRKRLLERNDGINLITTWYIARKRSS